MNVVKQKIQISKKRVCKMASARVLFGAQPFGKPGGSTTREAVSTTSIVANKMCGKSLLD
jgi:hypothetical protein